MHHTVKAYLCQIYVLFTAWICMSPINNIIVLHMLAALLILHGTEHRSQHKKQCIKHSYLSVSGDIMGHDAGQINRIRVQTFKG